MRRLSVIVMTVVLVAAAPACSGDEPSSTSSPPAPGSAPRSSRPARTTTSTTEADPPRSTSTAPVGPREDVEAIVLAECDRRTTALLGVVALSPDDAHELGRRQTGVASAADAQPYRCSDPGTATPDLQHLAVVRPTRADPQQVGLFDLDTAVVRTAPATGGEQVDPAIVDGALWFVAGGRPRTLHRWVDGEPRAEAVGTCPDDDTGAPDPVDPVPARWAVAAYRTCLGIDAYRLLVAPDGSRLVAGGSDSVLYVDATTGTEGRLLAASGDGIDVCRPQQWVSPTAYLCLDDVALATIDLAAGTVRYRRLAPEPEPGSRSLSPVASPDGSRVAYITCRARACVLDVASLTGAADPVEVGPLPEMIDPYLLTWSGVTLPAFVPHDSAYDRAPVGG